MFRPRVPPNAPLSHPKSGGAAFHLSEGSAQCEVAEEWCGRVFRLGPGSRRPDPSAPAAGATASPKLFTWRTGARIYSLITQRYLTRTFSRNMYRRERRLHKSSEELFPVLPRAATRPTAVTLGTGAREAGGALGCSPLRGVRPEHIRLRAQRANHLRNPVFGPWRGPGHAADTWNAAREARACDREAKRQHDRTREASGSRAPRRGTRSVEDVLRSSSL